MGLLGGTYGGAYIPEAEKYALLTQFNDHVLVATCDKPTGAFVRHNEIDMTNIIGTPNTGDMTVFTDSDTYKSYLCYSYGKGRGRIYISEIGGADSPVLNAGNTKDDRLAVMGNYCLNMQDKVDFIRQVSQVVKSSPTVPLPDGLYTLTCYVKTSTAFNDLYMYAKVGLNSQRMDLPSGNTLWKRVQLENVKIKGGRAEVGFYADGIANSWCRIDDVSLIRTGDLSPEDLEEPVEDEGEPLSVTWTLGLGTEDAISSEVSLPGYIGESVFDHGKLTVSKTYAVGTSQQTLYHPSHDNSKSVNNDDVLTFTIKPKEGVKFMPKTFSFEAC